MEKKSLPLQVINFNAAGIDVGSRSARLVPFDQGDCYYSDRSLKIQAAHSVLDVPVSRFRNLSIVT